MRALPVAGASPFDSPAYAQQLDRRLKNSEDAAQAKQKADDLAFKAEAASLQGGLMAAAPELFAVGGPYAGLVVAAAAAYLFARSLFADDPSSPKYQKWAKAETKAWSARGVPMPFMPDGSPDAKSYAEALGGYLDHLENKTPDRGAVLYIGRLALMHADDPNVMAAYKQAVGWGDGPQVSDYTTPTGDFDFASYSADRQQVWLYQDVPALATYMGEVLGTASHSDPAPIIKAALDAGRVWGRGGDGAPNLGDPHFAAEGYAFMAGAAVKASPRVLPTRAPRPGSTGLDRGVGSTGGSSPSIGLEVGAVVAGVVAVAWKTGLLGKAASYAVTRGGR